MSSLRSNILVQPQEIFVSSSTQGTDVGASATTGDGRYFRYALGSGTALVAGKLYQTTPQDTTNYQNLAVLAAGTNTLVVTTSTTTTFAANALTGGWLTVRTTPGQGFQYKISSHAATSAGTVAFNLEDPIQITLSTASVIDVTPNPYANVIVSPTTRSGIAAGVAVNNTTLSQYGWLQTRGCTNVLTDTAITVGNSVSPSTNVAGAVMPATGTQAQVLGYAMITTTDTKYAPVFLTMD